MRRVLEQVRNHARGSRPQGVHETAPEAGPSPEQLLKVLYAQDRRREPGRSGGDLIHASSLCKGPRCARKLILAHAMKQEGVTFDEAPFGNMRMVWAFGRAVENHIRAQLLEDPAIRAAAYGQWHCRCRHTHHRGHFPIGASNCTRCGTKPDRYGELPLHNTALQLVGNPDFILKQGTHYTVVEIKSIKKESSATYVGFDGLTEPTPMHVEQGTHYVHLGRDNALPMHRKPIVIYAAKDFMQSKWYKALVPNDQLMAQVDADVLDARERAGEFARAKTSGEVPPKIDPCQRDKNKHQKACEVWAECVANG